MLAGRCFGCWRSCRTFLSSGWSWLRPAWAQNQHLRLVQLDKHPESRRQKSRETSWHPTSQTKILMNMCFKRVIPNSPSGNSAIRRSEPNCFSQNESACICDTKELPTTFEVNLTYLLYLNRRD